MSRLLFEIGTEELPALSIDPALDFIKSYIEKALIQNSLGYTEIKTYGTPRRLVLIAEGLKAQQDDLTEEITGPKAEIAFLPNGDLSPQGLGFINARSISLEEVYKKETPKGLVIAARVTKLGRPAQEVLPQILIELLRAIPFKKRMFWETSGDTFARPIRWLTGLLDHNYLKLSFADVESGDFSFGHRFMAPEKFKVTSIEQYLTELAERFVMLSPEERKNKFLQEANSRAQEVDGQLCVDNNLLDLVKNLVEYPFVIMGEYGSKYLAIPKEILICEMREHQKCFAVQDKNNNLLPYFITSAASKPYDEKVFAKGNARVIRARFEDGSFYFHDDMKKGIEYFADNLKNLVFEQTLGTMADKVGRITHVALSLAKKFNLNNSEQQDLLEAAKLCKADLLSGVVGEFPELQGIMGRIYAEAAKKSHVSASAIETHYWPRFAEDLLPPEKIASLLAIADKLDTVVGIIAIGKMPTASKDPFALRRAALGIIKILVKNNFSIALDELINISIDSYDKNIIKNTGILLKEVKDFILQRARGLLAEQREINLVESVLAVGKSDLVDIFVSLESLYNLRKQDPDNFDSLIQTFKRAGNIIKKSDSFKPWDESLANFLTHPSEIELLQEVKKAKNIINNNNLNIFYHNLFMGINNIKPKLDKFFDDVMVMDNNINLKTARLALLNEIKILTCQIADLGVIN